MNDRESCLATRFSKGRTGNTSSWELGTGSGTGAIGHAQNARFSLKWLKLGEVEY